MKKIIFKKIKFISFKENEFNKIIKNKGLFVFPAAPALAKRSKLARQKSEHSEEKGPRAP